VSLEVEKLKGVAGMIICIPNKHARLSMVCELATQLLCIMHNCNHSKNAEGTQKHRIPLIKMAEWQVIVNLGC